MVTSRTTKTENVAQTSQEHENLKPSGLENKAATAGGSPLFVQNTDVNIALST